MYAQIAYIETYLRLLLLKNLKFGVKMCQRHLKLINRNMYNEYAFP